MNKGQQAFVEQMARKMLVTWCDQLMRAGNPDGTVTVEGDNPYIQYALTRPTPWISNKGMDPPSRYKVLAAGWQVAANFLKR